MGEPVHLRIWCPEWPHRCQWAQHLGPFVQQSPELDAGYVRLRWMLHQHLQSVGNHVDPEAHPFQKRRRLAMTREAPVVLSTMVMTREAYAVLSTYPARGEGASVTGRPLWNSPGGPHPWPALDFGPLGMVGGPVAESGSGGHHGDDSGNRPPWRGPPGPSPVPP